MMPGHLRALLLQSILIGFSKMKSLHGLTLPIPSLHKLSLFTKSLHHLPEYAVFDRAIANLHIRSEHCMGALKRRFQCPHGLQVTINNKQQHIAAFQWMTIAIILPNIVEVEGTHADYFVSGHTQA